MNKTVELCLDLIEFCDVSAEEYWQFWWAAWYQWLLLTHLYAKNPVYTSPLPPYALHAPPISFFLFWSPAQYWVRSTDYSAPPHVIFSIPIYSIAPEKILTFWHRSFISNSNKSPAWCNNVSVYYPDVFCTGFLSHIKEVFLTSHIRTRPMHLSRLEMTRHIH
jgi:hypothetical protein